MSEVQLPDGRRMDAEAHRKALALLQEDFPKDQIEKLPKPLKGGRDQARFQCRPGTQASADGYHCGGYHSRAIHLDYIGHATITERLNAVDPFWTIEFMVRHPETGEPKVDADGTWFNMTVLGVTRPCVGDSGGKPLNGNGRKELMGDAIRNGAMRFGVGTYLWSKSEDAERRKLGEALAADTTQEPAAPAEQAGRNWQRLYADAHAGGPARLRNFLNWARSNGGPSEMLNQGEHALAAVPVEGEIVDEA